MKLSCSGFVPRNGVDAVTVAVTVLAGGQGALLNRNSATGLPFLTARHALRRLLPARETAQPACFPLPRPAKLSTYVVPMGRSQTWMKYTFLDGVTKMKHGEVPSFAR